MPPTQKSRGKSPRRESRPHQKSQESARGLRRDSNKCRWISRVPPLSFRFFWLYSNWQVPRLGLDCYRRIFPCRFSFCSSNFDAVDYNSRSPYSAVVVTSTPFCYQLTAMSTKKPTPRSQATMVPSITQSQSELASSRPAVSLDPRDYFYPSSINGPSIWSIRMEQALVKSASMKVLPSSTSLLSDEYSGGGTNVLSPNWTRVKTCCTIGARVGRRSGCPRSIESCTDTPFSS